MTLPTLSVAHEVRAIAQDEPQERTCGCRCRQCSAFIHDERDCFHPRQDLTQDRAAEVREIGEWDWWDTRRGDRLHAAEVAYDPVRDVGGDGTTACGLKTELWIPGLLTRMGLLRCSRCCKRLGYPQGKGSPKNDWRCRPLVKTRLAAKSERTATGRG